MKKRMLLFIMLLAAAAFACACSFNALPEGFEMERVFAKAERVARLLLEEDYDGAAAVFSAGLSAEIDAQGLENALGGAIERLGAFKRIISKAATGNRDAQIGGCAVPVLVCAYENGTATYTVGIDSDGYVSGLYMK